MSPKSPKPVRYVTKPAKANAAAASADLQLHMGFNHQTNEFVVEVRPSLEDATRKTGSDDPSVREAEDDAA
jgi:hypothetical protein